MFDLKTAEDCDRCYVICVAAGLTVLGVFALVLGWIGLPVWLRGILVVLGLVGLWYAIGRVCRGLPLDGGLPSGISFKSIVYGPQASKGAGAADSGAVAKADAEKVAAEKAAAEKAAAEKAAAEQAATEKAAAEKVAAEKAMAEKAAKHAKAEAEAKAAEAARAEAAGEEDFDGDGIIEGTFEGTKPEALDGPRGGMADDLKRIKGVGPKLEELCHSLGFYHFDQISNWTADEVAWVDANLEGFKGRVSRDEWVSQAKILAQGGETDFSKRVDDGDVPSSQ